jgi:flagellar M-ring protein FliF
MAMNAMTMGALGGGLKALGPARLGAMAAVALGTLGLLALLVLRGGSEPMALLYGDLDLRDSAQVVEQLSRHHVPYRIAGGGAEILVPSAQVPEARLLLAKDGLPTGGSIGYEIFDRGDGFAATEFQQKVNETRALEGELSRTIRAVHGVHAVRVHLVLPKREPFAREQQDAQASVLLTMTGAARLDREGVQAILNLIASAVPGLRPKNIAIVDSRGDLLARAGDASGPAAAALSGDEVRGATELRLSHAVEEMLERTLGPGHVRAEASVRMNFDRVSETQERYDPDGQVPRSTQTVTTSSKTAEAAATVSAQNNLPNADAGAPGGGAGTQESRQEETTNFEIGKTVRTLIREQPQIDRITLAVMVDGTDAVGPDGKTSWQPRSGEDLARIEKLVKSAVGYDEKRGDHVEVVSMRFAGGEAPAEPVASGWLPVQMEKPDLMHLAQTALFGVIAVLALLLVLRPMVLRITSFAPGGLLEAGGAPGGTLGGGTPAAGMLSAGGARALPSPGSPALAHEEQALLEDQTMVNIAQIEGQMRASSLRQIANIVEKHPEETISIMRGWLAQESK